jgi:peptidoglycan/xylan/chitin deacetylase (PgdA/CDA1 family)
VSVEQIDQWSGADTWTARLGKKAGEIVTAGGLTEQGTWKAVTFIPYELMHKKWQYHLLQMLREHVDDPRVQQDIDRGFAAMKEASGGRVAPFFRYPGLNNSDELNDFLGSRNIAVISCDIGTDDWMRIGAEQIVKRTLARLESKGKGIILLHDTEPATAQALPTLLDELATRGYRIVHMVPKAEGVAALKPPEGASLKTP